MLYAKQLIDGIPNDSLTVFDRGFLSAEILCALIRGGSERHFVIPAKSNTRWEVIEGPHRGAKLRTWEDISTESGRINLKRICEAAGVSGPIHNTAELHNNPMVINLGIKDGGSGGNVFRGYKRAVPSPCAERTSDDRPVAQDSARAEKGG